jgi:hypothetical protein
LNCAAVVGHREISQQQAFVIVAVDTNAVVLLRVALLHGEMAAQMLANHLRVGSFLHLLSRAHDGQMVDCTADHRNAPQRKRLAVVFQLALLLAERSN